MAFLGEIMNNTIKGSVDFIAPKFLHALGIAVATFAQLESVLTVAFFVARHKTQDYALFPKSLLEIHDANFSTKIDKLFSELRLTVENFEDRGFQDLQDDFHKARQARNFVVHGVWLRGSSEDSYKCSMIDNKGRTVQNEVNIDTILGEATRANRLMIELKSLLVSEGFYPSIGPSIDGRSE
jgi:hypothetical protein